MIANQKVKRIIVYFCFDGTIHKVCTQTGGGRATRQKHTFPIKSPLFPYSKVFRGREGVNKHSNLCVHTLWMTPFHICALMGRLHQNWPKFRKLWFRLLHLCWIWYNCNYYLKGLLINLSKHTLYGFGQSDQILMISRRVRDILRRVRDGFLKEHNFYYQFYVPKFCISSLINAK